MTIEKVSMDTAPTYDHRALAAAALAEPGEWFTDTAEEFPALAPGQIRGGAMRDYRPAGAFDVRRRGGIQRVAFLGVPTTPWVQSPASSFHAAERTLDDRECPEGTPEHVVEALRHRRKVLQKAAKKRAERLRAVTLPKELRG